MTIPRLTYFPDSNSHGFSIVVDNTLGSLKRVLDELSKEDCNLIGLEGSSPPQSDVGKMFLVLELAGEQKSPKDVGNVLRMSKSVRSVKHIEPLTIGLVADSDHFPLGLIPGRGGRCFVIREYFWRALFESGYDRLGAEATKVFLYNFGLSAGKGSVATTREMVHLEAEDMLKIILHEGKALGWWDGKGEANVSRNHLVLRLQGNWEGELTKKWKIGCHFVRGFWDEVVSELLGRRVRMIETACISKGSPYCELRLT
jgi:predicted hydrocarbon binding protein